LGDQFIGMYLYGSLAYGGFDRDSDVDFVVVTTTELSEATFKSLRALHDHIATLDSWCATQLEGSYPPLHALRQFDPRLAFHLHIDRGPDEQLQKMHIQDPSLSRAWWGGWIFLRSVLWENGIILAGPSPRTLTEPVLPEELKQAALATLEGCLAPLLEQPAELAKRGYQSYIVLTVCRILYTLERGAIVSKQVASRWAQEWLEEPWRTLIERAWAGRHNPDEKATEKDLRETQDFIRYLMEITNYRSKE